MNRIGDTLIHFHGNEALVRALSTAGVNFVLIGGLAVAWYVSERMADDMDFLIEPTMENGATISQVLQTLRLPPHSAAELSKLGVQVQLKNSFFYAELLTPTKDGLSYAEVAAEAVDGKLFDIPIRIASVSSLVKLKKIAITAGESNRDKHLKDIHLLNRQAL